MDQKGMPVIEWDYKRLNCTQLKDSVFGMIQGCRCIHQLSDTLLI